jgi:hypothetical protein
MKVKIISSADVAACPIRALSFDHYRDDGTCLCVPEPRS